MINLDCNATVPLSPEYVRALGLIRQDCSNLLNLQSFYSSLPLNNDYSLSQSFKEREKVFLRAIGGEEGALFYFSSGSMANQAAIDYLYSDRDTYYLDAEYFHKSLGAPRRISEATKDSVILVPYVDHAYGSLVDWLSLPGKTNPIHYDMVQALGKTNIHLGKLNASSASFSAHKVGGPKGLAFLWVRNDFDGRMSWLNGFNQGTPPTDLMLAFINYYLSEVRFFYQSKESLIWESYNNLVQFLNEKGVENELVLPFNNRQPLGFTCALKIDSLTEEKSNVDFCLELAGKRILTSTGSACTSGVDMVFQKTQPNEYFKIIRLSTLNPLSSHTLEYVGNSMVETLKKMEVI